MLFHVVIKTLYIFNVKNSVIMFVILLDYVSITCLLGKITQCFGNTIIICLKEPLIRQ